MSRVSRTRTFTYDLNAISPATIAEICFSPLSAVKAAVSFGLPKEIIQHIRAVKRPQYPDSDARYRARKRAR